jgi:hypothetical protein
MSCSISAAVIALLMLSGKVSAQQIYLDTFGKKVRESDPLKIGGGVSANTIFYNGNDGQGRQPFTYFLNGNVNFNLYGQVNLPFSFNITNLGNDFTYPTLPNRLSVHPVYKWVTGHIGDVSMSFSPYTLNGHMFRGVGVDLAPEGPLKLSAMYGRLQRKVEYNPENPLVPASYERFGYGAKVRYEKNDYSLGVSFLSAKDDPNSLAWKPDSLNLFPKGNVAMSWEGSVKLLQNLQLSGEYGLSFLTRDIRSSREGSSLLDRTFANRSSTSVYGAIRGELNFQMQKNIIGMGYERIDPEYATLGAYYFNNDYENLTLRYSRPLWHDKVNLALTWGVQRDNLNNKQEQTSKRLVSSANIDYTPNEKLIASFSYSSFQTHMNIRSQFDYINGQTPYDNLDTLNFTQLSQNMALNTNYMFGKNESRKHNLNVNLSFQEAVDKQGDIVKPGNLSQFFNLNTSYNLLFVPEAFNVQVGFNATYNYVSSEDYIILGPMLGLRAKVIKKKITTGISASYNSSRGQSVSQAKVLNLRWNAAYSFLKRNNLNASVIWQQRDSIGRDVRKSTTATVGYSYSF